MTSSRLSPLSCGLSLALTAALLYLACALVVAWSPGALAAGLGLIVHGLSLSGLSPAVGELRWGAVLVGTLAIAGYFALIMTGFLVQWPTLITLVLYLVMLITYVRLAISEERDSRARFGAAYEHYAEAVPRFFPRRRRTLAVAS